MVSARSLFLDFFAKNNHLLLPSASLIPSDDPTLLFVNAGMAPLKTYFLGHKLPPNINLVSCQKCIRAGGKHNDLDQVGYTKRHHTFFEMCGNFSFGGYGHEQAILFAWEFLTITLDIDQNKLWITVHPDDYVSYNIWSRIVNQSRILKLAENEWSMGSDGPCGMCTEIFYDHGESIEGTIEDGDRFVEVWNIVFMTHQVQNGVKSKLNTVCIDTGMGLERINAVLANTHDNYQAPFFREIIDTLSSVTNKSICPDHKIIIDHARAVTFAISDGVLPDTSGRGYVIRKILRRALSRAWNTMDADEECGGLVKLAANYTIEKMYQDYPEIMVHKGLICDVIDFERNQLKEVLINGKKYITKLTENCIDTVPGDVLFKLHDTYGMQIDLVADVLESMRLKPNIDEFELILKENKLKNQKQQKGLFVLQSYEDTEFVGYTNNHLESIVKEIGNLEGEFYLILDRTPFYAEEGGQEADHGYIKSENGIFRVNNVKKHTNVILHLGEFESGSILVGDACHAEINKDRRKKLMQHHSATHLLLAALRKYLGSDVVQKGSLVKEDGLRFDFLCHQKLDDKLSLIEQQVNEWIQQNIEGISEVMPQSNAKDRGAIATFGEKYGDTVRVVKLGESIELCCGTHVERTGDIGSFYILKARSIAASVKRIEAVAGSAAYEYARNKINQLTKIATELNTSDDQIIDLINKSRGKHSPSQSHPAVYENASVSGLSVIGAFYIDSNQSALLKATDDLIQSNDIVLVVNHQNNKTSLMLKTKSNELDARKLLSDVIQLNGGEKCGGRIDFAQGGLSTITNSPEIFSNLIAILKGKM